MRVWKLGADVTVGRGRKLSMRKFEFGCRVTTKDKAY